MTNNYLKLNEEKTETIVIEDETKKDYCPQNCCKIGSIRSNKLERHCRPRLKFKREH